MGVYDAPQWLLPAFVRSVQAVGGTAQPEEIRSVGEALLDRWTAPERRFHNLKHLVSVLARVDELTEETHEPDLVRLAAWYHGAIFDAALSAALATHGGEDEAASADVAYRELTGLGVPEAKVRRIRDLVVRLARHTPDPTDPDSAVLCDADLGMLAVEPQRYKAYLEDLRAEYAHVPKIEFLRARRRILHKLLARTSLFVSPMSERWEEPARQNISAELARVEKEVARLEAEQAAADEAAAGRAGSDGASARAGDERAGDERAGTTSPTSPGAEGAPGTAAGGDAPEGAMPTPTGPTAITRITAPTRPVVAVIPKSVIRQPLTRR